MLVSAIVAVAANNVIGKDNDIPWRGKLRGEQLLFKEYTEGKTVIMGRNTWESIPAKYRPLKRRLNIVLSRNPDLELDGCALYNSLETALEEAAENKLHGKEAVLIGGGGVYEAGLKYCDRIYLTKIDGVFPGDVFFPELSDSEWRTTHVENHPADPEKGQCFDYKFLILERQHDQVLESKLSDRLELAEVSG